MATLVGDANVLIDLDVASITRLMFRLEHTFVVPNTLYQEELAANHSELPGLGLEIEALSGEAIAEVVRLMPVYSGLSYNDLSALALAKCTNRTLLTGEALLRRIAPKESVEVCGTLWLMESMHVTGLVDIAGMETAYEAMRNNGRRLPWNEIEAQLERLRCR